MTIPFVLKKRIEPQKSDILYHETLYNLLQINHMADSYHFIINQLLYFNFLIRKILRMQQILNK